MNAADYRRLLAEADKRESELQRKYNCLRTIHAKTVKERHALRARVRKLEKWVANRDRLHACESCGNLFLSQKATWPRRICSTCYKKEAKA